MTVTTSNLKHLALALALGAGLMAGSAQALDLGKIMPMGDSITDGVPVAGGYRDPLYTLLNSKGDTFTFVGSATNNETTTLSAAGQTHHEGHSGYVIAAGGGRTGLDENLAGWIGSGAENPNRILLMIGSNDINLGYDMANAPARLSTLITHIYGYRPAVKLYVASIIPMSGHEADVRVFNTAIPGIVASHRALGQDVVYVPMYESLNINTDLADGLHPNALGYQHMAQAWDTALHGVPEPASLHAIDLTSAGDGPQFGTRFSVGWDFTVTQTLTVTSLGQFDPDSNPKTNTVAIYQRGGAKLVEASVPATNPEVPSGSYNARYTVVSNLVLPPGNYVVMSTQNGDNFIASGGTPTATVGTGITWNRGVALADGSSAGPLPATAPVSWPIENATASRYFGPTFKYQLGSIADAKILSFGITDYPAVIDESAGTIAWTVPYGTVVSALAPAFTLSAGATCNQSSGAIPTPAFGGSTPVVYEVTSSDGKVVKDYTVTVIVAPQSSACDILTFGPGAVVNQSAQTIVWAVAPGTEVQNLAPMYTMSPLATGAPVSGTSRNFATPQTYTITAQNGIATKTYTVTVVVLIPPPVGGYARWFDASMIVGKSNGDPVTTWADLSANAANATVPGGHASPTFVANAGTGKGLPALHFTAGGGGSGALKFAEDSSIRTVFSVFKGNSFLLTDIQSGQYHFHRWGANDTDPTVPIWDGPGGSWASPNIRGGSTYVNGVSVNGTTYYMPTDLYNGYNLVEVVTTGAVTADSWNADRNSVHTGDQYQAEVIIYDRVLSEDERVAVEHYLMSKWFGVSYAPDAKILTFGLPGMPVAIDNTAMTIAWTVPKGSDVTSLAPTFTLSTGATCNLASGATLNFSSPVTYTVTSSDLLVVNNYSVTVTVSELSVVNGLTCWFDAAQGTTTDGSGVLTWADMSGSGHPATRTNGTMQLAANAINGLPAVQFAGQATAAIAGSMYSKTQFIVTKMNGGDWGAWMGSQSRAGYLWNPNGNCWDGNVPAAVSKNGTALPGYPFYLGDNRNSQYMVVKIVGNDNVTSTRPYQLGRQEGWYSLNNYLAEIISYNTTLTEDDEDRIGGYLANKYNLATIYPPPWPTAIIKRFGSAASPAVINPDHTITWYVPYGTDVTSLAPTYKLVYGATCDKASGSTQNFSSPVTYTVTSSDSLVTSIYTVTITVLPDWPTLINVNYSANAANDNMNGIYSYDATAKGSASRAAPAAYSGNTWNDYVGSATASGSNLKDSQGGSTTVGFTTACNNGPWDNWTGLGTARLLKSAVGANYTTYTPVLTLTGLNTGHAYDLYLASLENDVNRPADFLVGATSKHVADSPGGATDWLEGRNYVRFAGLIPQPNGTVQVKAQGSGSGDGIVVNGFQIQDLGVRGLNPEALIYSFNFPSGTGASATTIDGTRIAVTMWTGTNVTALRPTFATSTGATCKVGGGTVVSGDAVNFTNPVHYIVRSEDGATTTDYTVTVNLIPSSGHLHVNIDNNARTGLVGPAPFSGVGKIWNAAAGAKTGSALLDEDGVMTGVGFNFNNFEGAGSWGNPSLKMLNGAVWWWSQNNSGEGVGVRTGTISGLTFGGKYDLYIASLWADQFSHGAFTVNGVSQDLDGQGASQLVWVQGANYVFFPEVAPDTTGKITITATATQKNGGNYPLMISGFQVLDTGVKSPYCDMLSFGPGAVITGTNIAWTVPYGTNLATLAPTFTTSGMATCSQPNNAVPTPNFSSGPVVYKVAAQDGIRSQNYTVTVTVVAPPLAGGLVCWYDAGGGITQDGSGVLTWADLSGQGHHATRGNGTVTLVPNEVNSRPAVHLRGGNTYLNCTAAAFSSIVKEQYVVVRSPNATWNGSGSFLGRKSDNFLTVRGSSYNMDSGYTGFWQDHFPVAVSKNGTPVPIDRPPFANSPGFLLGTITDYMVLKIIVDDGGVATFANYPYYQIGKNETLGTMDFDVAEIMGFDHALSAADENSVGSYLTTKYGLQTAYVVSGNYATWAGPDGYNLTGGPDGDDDRDGITNLMEYALGLNPKVPNGSPGTLTGNLLSFTKGTAARNNGDVTYAIETSPNLQDPWTTVVTHATGNPDPSISYLLPTGQGKIFARLKVTSTTSVVGGNYATWAGPGGYDLTGGPDGDDDHDGITNLMEYALGLNPKVPNGSPGTLAGNLLSFTKGTAARDNGDVTYSIESSPNLQSPWTPRVTQAAGNTAPTISYTLPPNLGKIFARLVVTQVP
ncbi:MAG: GDSL-type esterase/lipase family protein [Verrucomicrobia bacterium]|nr:GDSL-type esterase/lipase family protein [Verrucomicrobiota bacterium]